MPAFFINAKNDTVTTIGPVVLNVETTLVEYTGAAFDYIVEGYLDISAVTSSDSVTVTEYIAVDGTNYQIFKQDTFAGAQVENAIRFHAKTFYSGEKYKATIKQTVGVGRSFPIVFIQEIFNA